MEEVKKPVIYIENPYSYNYISLKKKREQKKKKSIVNPLSRVV